jgi:hypothetical protein
MRVYIPSTLDELRELDDQSTLPTDAVGYAATTQLADDLDGLGPEETEFALTSAAAEASLERMADSGHERGRRVVIVAEIPSSPVVERLDLPGVVYIDRPVELSQVDAILMDTADVDIAVGSDDDLGWYATQELGYLLA